MTNADDYRASSFAVSGKKIIWVKSADFTLHVFDTEGGTTESIDVTDIRLQNLPVGVQTPGHIRADGKYVALKDTIAGFRAIVDGEMDGPVTTRDRSARASSSGSWRRTCGAAPARSS